jgi:ABC-type transport system involved in cytochrome bd biosynthesis fused ATPase/permease subunit
VTHDPEELAAADRVWYMKDGCLVEEMSAAAYDDLRWQHGVGLVGSHSP